MKKKILGLFMTLAFIFTVGMSNVSAALLTWDTILTDYKKIIANDEFVVNSDSSSLTISYPKFKHGPYSIKINYDDINKKISYISTRDVTNFTDEQMVDYGSTDMYFLTVLLLDLFKLYSIDPAKMPDTDETDDLSKYGIIVDGKEVSYVEQDEDGGQATTTVTYPNSFTIDLNTFDQATASIQNTATDLSSYDVVFAMLKMFLPSSSDVSDSLEDSTVEKDDVVVEDVTDKTTEEVVVENKTEIKEDTTTEKNPQTGIKNIGISVLVVGLISFVACTIFKNKKLFVK